MQTVASRKLPTSGAGCTNPPHYSVATPENVIASLVIFCWYTIYEGVLNCQQSGTSTASAAGVPRREPVKGAEREGYAVANELKLHGIFESVFLHRASGPEHLGCPGHRLYTYSPSEVWTFHIIYLGSPAARIAPTVRFCAFPAAHL